MKKYNKPEDQRSREKYEFTMAATSISAVAIILILIVYALYSAL
jgi:hypothetical protein